MANRLQRTLSSLVDFIARFWPMSKDEDQVLRELSGAQPAKPLTNEDTGEES